MKQVIYKTVDNIAFLLSVISTVLFIAETNLIALGAAVVSALIGLLITAVTDGENYIEEGQL